MEYDKAGGAYCLEVGTHLPRQHQRREGLSIVSRQGIAANVHLILNDRSADFRHVTHAVSYWCIDQARFARPWTAGDDVKMIGYALSHRVSSFGIIAD